jgi:hypothetical protein
MEQQRQKRRISSTTMKKILPLILAIGTIAEQALASDTNQTATASCDAEISIKLKEPAKEIKTNEPVIATINIKNTSTNEILMLLIENAPTDFSWNITSPSGKDLSPTNSFPVWGSSLFPRLKPLELREIDYDLSSICSFNDAGTYKVVVKKEVFFLSPVRKKCEITSNPLDVVISK